MKTRKITALLLMLTVSVPASVGFFTHPQTAHAATHDFWVFIVAGGGGGGDPGGGGGAGGATEDGALLLTDNTAYTITVGSGGSAGSSGAGGDGNESSIGTVASSTGGGGGGYAFGAQDGRDGGSGGGGVDTTGTGGTGTVGQGNDGGDGNNFTTDTGGGGGGASAAGQDAFSACGGNGGNGTTTSISGSSTTYAGGGGGVGASGCGPGNGGTGGGGDGGDGFGAGGSGTANTGGGGGAGDLGAAGAGGSGVVVIRFATDEITVETSTGATETTSGGDTILTWNSSGTFEFSLSAATATTVSVSSVTRTSADVSGSVVISSDTADVGFVYSIGDNTNFNSTTTTNTGVTSSTAFNSSTSSLQALTEYYFKAFASSTASENFTFGAEGRFLTSTVATSVPVSASDITPWDVASFNDGTHSTTTISGSSLVLEAQGGTVATTTSSFESCSDGSTTFTSEALWTQATITSDNGDWQCENGMTTSSNTGADDGSDGTVFIYTEGSSSESCDNTGSGNDCAIEADIADSVDGTIIFDWNLDGAHIGKLSLDAYNGSVWTELWSLTGDQGVGATWASSTAIWSASDGYTALRFFHDVSGTGFESDASLDNLLVGTSTSSYEDGTWTSAAWDVGSISNVNGSVINFSSTTPSDTTVTVKTALNSSAVTPPADGDFDTVSDGGAIQAGGAGGNISGNLSGMYLWVRVELGASTDGQSTPTLSQLTMGIDEILAPTVSTDVATNIATSSATLNGNITATGGADATQHGFAYSIDATLSTGVSTTTLGSKSGTGAFSEAVYGLDAGATYYFRAYATNSAGTGYGSIVSTDTVRARIIRLIGGTRLRGVRLR